MEQAVRLEIANQKSLYSVWDVAVEKAMHRFSMVAGWHYRRIDPGVGIYTWKEIIPDGYLVTWFDKENRPAWLTLWSTELAAGDGETMWRETERFAQDFNRDTVLVSEDEAGGVQYRFYSPDRGTRAQVSVSFSGDVSGDNTEEFFRGLLKRWRRGALELEDLQFDGKEQACAWLDASFGFPPERMPARDAVLAAAVRGTLTSPFRVTALVRDQEYLAYDPKAEYKRVFLAVGSLLEPLGFRKTGGHFCRLWGDGAYMECFQFQRSRFLLDPRHDIEFTINVGWGPAEQWNQVRWRLKDFSRHHPACGQRIGLMNGVGDRWYQLFPGSNTQEIAAAVTAELRRAVAELDRLRTSEWT